MLSLYELSEEQLALDALLSMDDGELTPEAEALAAELAEQLVTKADAFGGYVTSLESHAKQIKEERDRLAAREKALLNKAVWLKRYALVALTRMDRPKIEGTLFTLAIQNNPPSVNVMTDISALPAEYVRIVPESRDADKPAIAKALKAGIDIPGCSLTTTQSLRIK